MLMPSGYQRPESLYQSDSSAVYRVWSQEDQGPVLLKRFCKTPALPQDIAQFKREYLISNRFSHPNLCQSLRLLQQHGQWLMVLQDIGAQSLARYLAERRAQPPDLAAFFALALQLCAGLSELHQRRVIHKDINPANLVWNGTTLQIIDFGIASELAQETAQIHSPAVLEGTLAYMAPEQTGRMNRVVDYRSDYYAMGATLYEWLTGAPPFTSDDPIELIHAHIARAPDWSHPALIGLPKQLIAVLQRLLEKNAEHRYQSSENLRHDLLLCQALVLQPAQAPASQNLSEQRGVFQAAQKLYGREAELAQLMAAFERVAAGQSELLLVAGFSGIGKSALVNEVHKPMVAKRGYFVSGKFDQCMRNTPYASLIQAFQELLRQILSEPPQQVRHWASLLEQALGSEAGVIAELIPELCQLLGTCAPVPELPPAEAGHRLGRQFERFVQVFAARAHPLVIFLDDLQWADYPTLKLIELFLSEPNGRFMLIIGAYRDNEVDPSHPLMQMRDQLHKRQIGVHTLQLGPLSLADVQTLVTDTLHGTVDNPALLARLCYQKTQGNPFFLNQFLRSIYEAGYLTYSFEQQRWQTRLDELEGANFTDNVVELMSDKIGRLPPGTRQLLQLAASLGNRFDLYTLALAVQADLGEVQDRLWAAVDADLIRPIDHGYRFVRELKCNVHYRFLHDRMQQAAYAMANPRQKQEQHLQLGRLLLQHTPTQALDEHLFAIVEQLNLGRELILDPAERLQLARLNYQAGLKARASAAYQAAFRHIQIGVSLLPRDAWRSCFALALDLQASAAETAYLSGEFAVAEALYPQVLRHCSTVQQKIRCYLIQMDQYQLQGRFAEAIVIQRNGLQLLGWIIPEHDAALEQGVADGFAEIAALTQNRSMESIMQAAPMRAQEHLAAMQLLYGMWYASYLAGQSNLNALTTLMMTRLSLKHGNCDISSFAYVNYAFLLTFIQKQYRLGDEFGRMGVALSDQCGNLGMRCSAHFLFATFVNHWNRALASSFQYFDSSYEWALETGNFATIGYIIAVRSTDHVIAGHYLPDLLHMCARDLLVLKRTAQIDMIDCTTVGSIAAIKNLMGLTRDVHSYDDEQFSEAQFLNDYQAAPLHLAYFYHGKIRAAYLFDSPNAAELADKLPLVEQFVPAQCKIPEATFYAALIWLRLLQREPNHQQRSAMVAKLDTLTEHLAEWASQCPANFGAKYTLLQAERANWQQQPQAAIAHYLAAIRTAHQTGYPQLQALANECYGYFLLAQDQTVAAEAFLAEAVCGYRDWGAAGKVAQLLARFPEAAG